MDKRTNYGRLVKLINELENETISLDELRVQIAMNIATDPKRMENAIKTMAMTGLIKDIGNFRFQVIKTI